MASARCQNNQVLLETVKDVSIIIGGAIAFLTLWQGLVQYARQNHAIRAAQFIDLRRRFLEEKSFQTILTHIHRDCSKLKDVTRQERRNLVGFLEEIALMVNSGLVRPEVAHYMFGYYVLLIADCEPFWDGLERDSDYWAVFRAFAARMRTMSVSQDMKSGRIKI